MCCLLLVLASGAPRVAIILMWLFSDRMANAYESWILPTLGFLFLPWTTVFYALAYYGNATYNIGPGVSGIGWFFVALGFFFDIASYSGGAKQRAQQASA